MESQEVRKAKAEKEAKKRESREWAQIRALIDEIVCRLDGAKGITEVTYEDHGYDNRVKHIVVHDQFGERVRIHLYGYGKGQPWYSKSRVIILLKFYGVSGYSDRTFRQRKDETWNVDRVAELVHKAVENKAFNVKRETNRTLEAQKTAKVLTEKFGVEFRTNSRQGVSASFEHAGLVFRLIPSFEDKTKVKIESNGLGLADEELTDLLNALGVK